MLKPDWLEMRAEVILQPNPWESEYVIAVYDTQ